jgi:hypothetical protein
MWLRDTLKTEAASFFETLAPANQLTHYTPEALNPYQHAVIMSNLPSNVLLLLTGADICRYISFRKSRF